MKAATSVDAWVTAAKKRFDARKAARLRVHRPLHGEREGGREGLRGHLPAVRQGAVRRRREDPRRRRALRVRAAAVARAARQFVQAYRDAVNRVLTGQQSPKEALDQAQKEAQAAIDANKK